MDLYFIGPWYESIFITDEGCISKIDANKLV